MSSIAMGRSELRLKSPALLVIFIFVMKFSREVDAACQQGWDHFMGSCYKVVASRATYPEALGLCERSGSQLLTITSELENKFIANLLTGKKFIDCVWIGINDLFSEGHWVYSDTQKALTYTNWLSFEPNNHGAGEDCGEMYNDGPWNDCSCHSRLFFVCEKQFVE